MFSTLNTEKLHIARDFIMIRDVRFRKCFALRIDIHVTREMHSVHLFVKINDLAAL